uniref:Uncharacterized protein n=1 Tax=Sphaerodactylus townsendi TaxID=933632 RepID=A0ACB8G4A9_9SAUR
MHMSNQFDWGCTGQQGSLLSATENYFPRAADIIINILYWHHKHSLFKREILFKCSYLFSELFVYSMCEEMTCGLKGHFNHFFPSGQEGDGRHFNFLPASPQPSF